MSEDGRTLWVDNLDPKVTEHLLYELFLQTGPIDRLILPADGEGEKKRHKGQAYVVFRHTDSVQYAAEVLDGSCLFSVPLSMKAKSLPGIYKSLPSPGANTHQGNKSRFDNSALRTGFNKATTWHGQSDLVPRGRGNFRGQRGGSSNLTPNPGQIVANTGSYSNQTITDHWTPSNSSGGTNVPTQDFGPQKTSVSQLQAQAMWRNTGYNTGSWNISSTGGSAYGGYSANQYGGWYQQ